MRRSAIVGCLVFGSVTSAAAGTLEQSLAKLDPEERAHQACIILGIDQLRRDKQLPQADRMKTGIFGPAAFDGTVVKASGGAVRANHRWYSLNFTCIVSKDQMKATSFAYKLGSEIPEVQWEDLGLWR
jgi:hypothetical protein